LNKATDGTAEPTHMIHFWNFGKPEHLRGVITTSSYTDPRLPLPLPNTQTASQPHILTRDGLT